jgi:hypothetical protein
MMLFFSIAKTRLAIGWKNMQTRAKFGSGISKKALGGQALRGLHLSMPRFALGGLTVSAKPLMNTVIKSALHRAKQPVYGAL